MRLNWRHLLAATALACSAPAYAGAPADLVGTYDGHQTEVGAGLRLEANGRYEYFLSYGALDEESQGTWAAEGDGIVLTSDKYKLPAFELIGTKPGGGSTLDITLDVPKSLDRQYFSALLLMPDHTASETQFEEGGPLRIPLSGASRPSGFVLGLEVFDVMSEPFDIPPNTRSMHFRFVANDLGKVTFDHQRLARQGSAFVLERFGRKLEFRKEAPENASEQENVPDN